MAIVRTTPKETNNTGVAPPRPDAGATTPLDKTRSVVRPKVKVAPARVSEGGRAVASARTQAPVRPTSTKDFVNDTMTELRRVVWPTKQEVRSGTIVTIGLLIFFAIYIFGLDALATWVFTNLGLYPK